MLVFIWAIFATMSLVFMLGYEFHAHNTVNHDEIVPRVRKAGEASPARGRSGAIKSGVDDDDDKAVVHHDGNAAAAVVQQKSKVEVAKAPIRVCRGGKPVRKLIYIKVLRRRSSVLLPLRDCTLGLIVAILARRIRRARQR